MKKILNIILCCLPLLSFAEEKCMANMNFDPEEYRAQIESQKIAYFTKKLELTPQEAEKFWPLYNAYMKERDSLQKNYMKKTYKPGDPKGKGKGKMHKDFDVSKLSDAEAQKVLDDKLRMLDLEKEFHLALCKMFSPKRVLAYYDCERGFHRELLNMMNGRRPEPPTVKKESE